MYLEKEEFPDMLNANLSAYFDINSGVARVFPVRGGALRPINVSPYKGRRTPATPACLRHGYESRKRA